MSSDAAVEAPADWHLEGGARGRDVLIVAVILGAGIALSLLGTWEMDGESWGYWYFARLFNDTGLLPTSDRSPLYVLYLSAFARLPYPGSVIAEYIVTSAVFCASFVSLFRNTKWLIPASVGAVLMLPTIWTCPPNCQILALSCAMFAFAALTSRRSPVLRISIALALLGLATAFRSTYIVALPIVALYLALSPAWGEERFSRRMLTLARAAIPLVLILGSLALYVRHNQADHPWNNVFFASTRWFPVNTASLFDSGFISHLNWIYIDEQYPGQKGIDFYRTNQELFQGAQTAREAFAANPDFVVHALTQNAGRVLDQTARMTTIWVPLYVMGFPTKFVFLFVGAGLAIAVAAAIVTRSFRPELRVMFLCFAAIALTSVLAMPKRRYFGAFAPVLFFLCVWLIGTGVPYLRRILLSRARVRLPVVRLRGASAVAVCALFAAISADTLIAMNVAADRMRGDVAILQRQSGSMKASFSSLSTLATGCRGVISLEHSFVGAFVAPGSTKVYDVFEIPPFGTLSSGEYRGLHPQRVDCVFVSGELEGGAGQGTETFNRFHSYIEPYAAELTRGGGERFEVPGYGYVVRAAHLGATATRR